MLLPDRKTRLALGSSLPYLQGYWSSRRTPVEAGGTVKDLIGRAGDLGLGGGGVPAETHYGEGICFGGNGAAVLERKVVDAYPFALSAWFKPQTTDSACIMQIVDKSETDVMYGMQSIDNTVRIFMRNTTYIYAEAPSNATPLNQYSHVFGFFESSISKKLYVNGAFAAELTTFGTFNANVDRLAVGQFLDSTPSGPLTGYVDEMMVLNGTVPSASVALALYQAQRHLFGV